MNKEYLNYLKSYAWKLKKQEVFLERGRTCEKCMSKKDVQIHHLTYKNIYREKPEDLQILCKCCHEKEHGIVRRKKKKGKAKWNKNRTQWTSDKFNKTKEEQPKRYCNREEIKKRIQEANKTKPK